MNKKKILTACVLSGALLTAGSVFAHGGEQEHPGYFAGFGSRVSHGLANITTGVVELPKNVINVSHNSNIFVGTTWGLLRGVFETVGRTVVGAGELITSPIPVKPFITPNYVWDRFSEDTRYFGKHLPGYWTKYGPLDDGNDD